MKRWVTSLCSILTLALSTGCIHPRQGTAAKPSVLVPVSCLVADVVLKDCDVSVSPPKCRHAVVTYKAGCAVIKVH